MPLTVRFWVATRPANFVKQWPDGVPLPRRGEEVDLQWPEDLLSENLVVREVTWSVDTLDGDPSVGITLSAPGPWTRPPKPV